MRTFFSGRGAQQRKGLALGVRVLKPFSGAFERVYGNQVRGQANGVVSHRNGTPSFQAWS